ncbi:acyltransferase family protein [Flavobacterium wongokense]|uniref:acyltransferase family protein n=1 Tax=Flavobacterium wongokense TaxID=2910674 RepID=UPI001F3D9DD8|nr:acyltransferase [Flavobacterium sp. WG47]MCF6133022.1 acyltransferase [Flavobacterium sp. WG47]
MIDKENNFDFLRLLFSALVIVSHSYSLTDNNKDEIFLVISNGQIALGTFSVKCFFIISGYLIFISLKRSKNLLEYIWKRIVRIFPALVVVLLLTMLFLPLIYTGEGSIFSHWDYWSYFYRNLGLYHLQYNVEGIFEDNPYLKSINGSLWTIRYEFTMYLSLLLFFFFQRKLSQIVLLLTFGGLFVLANFAPHFLNSAIFSKFFLDTKDLYDLGCYFIAGSFLASVNFENFKYQKALLIACPILLIAATKMGYFHYAGYFLLPVIILSFGLSKTPYLKSIGQNFGDISYGVYIYGFVVQQSLLNFFDLGIYGLMFSSLAITMVFAYFSWHLIEKRALKLKTTFKA